MSTIFRDGTLYPHTKLSMMNRCLLAIGEVPLEEGTLVDELQLGTDADTARQVVEGTMIEVQSVGWYFNRDYNFKLYTDIQGFIPIPPNLLRIDVVGTNRYMLKDNKLYDTEKFTYVIDKPYIEADVMWLVDFPTIPPEAFEYISARAARKFQEYVVAAPDLTTITTRQEQDSYIRLQRRELQTRAYNIQNPRVSTRTHNGYLQGGLYGNKGRL